MQVKIVDGTRKVWDESLQSWRAIQPLDRIPPEEKPRRKYSCGNCGSQVFVTAYFSGWEDETVDMDTGDTVAVIDGGRDDVHEIQYRCVEDCGWNAGAEWKDEIEYGQHEAEQEAEEEAKQNSPQLYTFPIRPADFYEPF